MRETLAMEAARRKLSVVWLIALVSSFLVMVIRSLGGGFGDRQIDAWGWYLPTLFPTLSLMMSTFAVDMQMGTLPAAMTRNRRVDAFYFRVPLLLSSFYLVLVHVSLLYPADTGRFADPIAVLNLSNLWLGPLQGLTAGTIGWFFLRTQDAGPVGGKTRVDEPKADN